MRITLENPSPEVWESARTCTSIKFQPVTAPKTPHHACHIQHEKNFKRWIFFTPQPCKNVDPSLELQATHLKKIVVSIGWFQTYSGKMGVKHQTWIKKWLFRVPGPKVFHPFCLIFCLAQYPSYMKPSIHGKMSMPNPSPFQYRKSGFHSSFAA